MILPVELINFSGVVSENAVNLAWETASEINNSGFEIERKMSGINSQELEWNMIGFINGKGTTTEQQSYSFSDKNIPSGNYTYRLKQIDFDGTFEYSNIVEVSFMKPNEYSLEQNYPNPFNPSTKIKYAIAVADAYYASHALVQLKVYDILGNEVATLVNSEQPAGEYEVEFSATPGLASGIYMCRLIVNGNSLIRKMMLMK